LEHFEKLKISFYKYLNNELGEGEARLFLEHLRSGRDHDAFLLLIEESLDSPVADQLLDSPELFALLSQSFAKVNDIIDAKPKKRSVRLWTPGIAAAIALIVLGVYFFKGESEGAKQVQDNVVVNDVAPGTVGATLTLADGRKIKLSDMSTGEIAKEAGVRVTKTANGQLLYEIASLSSRATAMDLDPSKVGATNVLSTAKGETYQVKLPDGTAVWLNAASTLTYTTSLREGDRRVVRLLGEAYFQVAEDKSRPFIVETSQQQIEVLGTHFNVNAYLDEEDVTTTLLEGRVKVSNQSGSKILKPGDQSSVTEHSILITQVDTERAIAWKNNKFLFENDNIQYIMRMIERWYAVDVVYTGAMPTEKFGGGVSRFDNVSQVLRILESTGGAHFKIEGRKILVSK
jgi:ferric-dicitrate binding protein FerR (iron transport regulator)